LKPQEMEYRMLNSDLKVAFAKVLDLIWRKSSLVSEYPELENPVEEAEEAEEAEELEGHWNQETGN